MVQFRHPELRIGDSDGFPFLAHAASGTSQSRLPGCAVHLYRAE